MKHIHILGAALCLAACQAMPAPSPTPTSTPNPSSIVQAYTPIPTAILPSATSTASLTPTSSPTATFTSSPIPPSATPTHTTTPSPSPSPLPSSATPSPVPPTSTPTTSPTPALIRPEQFLFARPFDRSIGQVDYADRSYPFGGTQFGQRPVHLGVDFANARFSSVLAIGDGLVYYAGNDLAQAFGPQTDYYGNLVILQHTLTAPDGQPVYTLYGHLQEVDVETGQAVIAGQRIGSVGDTGVAIGPHLHLEVRVGDPIDYSQVRNPELWLIPYREFGLLVGRVTSASSADVSDVVVLVRSATLRREAYVYGDRVQPDPYWNENFTLGDLPVGDYEVIVSTNNGRVRFRQNISIEDRRATWVDIALD